MILKRKDKSDNYIVPPNVSPVISHSPKLLNTTLKDIDIDIKSIFQLVSARLVVILLIVWLILIQYMERSYPKHVLQKCQWQNWESWTSDSQPQRIALVADPQIIDDYSYSGRPSILNYFVKRITDNYLHRNYRYMQDLLDPHTTIFLGDLFDGGRYWDDKTWFEEYKRFNRIFPPKVNRLTITSIPGNHDIGFQIMDKKVINRFASVFGELNNVMELGNHTFVLLDSISLSSEDKQINKEPSEFLATVKEHVNPKLPTILLTHVPLYRFNDKQLCGSKRESNKLFPIQKGDQYQTVINYELSQKILSTIGPSLVFAGDDHDYCDIQQPYWYQNKDATAREITVKSASMSSGIRYPAIQLLSLNNPYNLIDHLGEKTVNTYETEMCYMPHPYYSLRMYILVYIMFIGLLVFKYLKPDITKIKSLLSRNGNSPELPTYDNAKTKLKPRSQFVPNKKGFIVNLIVATVIPLSILNSYYSTI
ncbi:Metallo-dependent phosphatase-like protein [Scheffersomyces amazonensis]|uniref:Metallo-dependent phosphatase-like protein n=1 Tax=Scheffersomyces amazonensis TaxID=1078765 RepID=UPI00315D8D93